jgi:multiple RNA-binding domain-containing protein 1
MKTVKEAEVDNDLQNGKENDSEFQSENNPQKPTAQYFTVKVRGLAYKAKRKDVKQFFLPLKPKSIRLPPKSKGIAYVGFKSEKELRQALSKHLTFLGKLYTYIRFNSIMHVFPWKLNSHTNFCL